jgi:uncharacterized protein (DUF1800 family)
MQSRKTYNMKNIFTLLICFSLSSLTAQAYDDYIGAGHKEGVIVTSSDQEQSDDLTLDGSGLGRDLIGTSRFLSQATLGANLGYINYVDSMGYDSWLEEQFNAPMTSYLEVTQEISAHLYDIYIQAGGDPEDYPVNLLQFRYAWSHIVMNAQDVLRHKVALALSEILVISTQSDLQAFGYGLADYYDILARNAFGNYKDLMQEITLHPAMGFYLSHLNNPRTIPQFNIHPDENYAREIMQLFSIGLYELNNDGSPKLGNDGLFIPTYDNDDIKELAKVFTGLGMGAWVLPDIPDPVQFGIPIFYIDLTTPMLMYEEWHETGPKTIVGDFTIPGGQGGMADIEMAVEHLFNHANVGPFLATRLIQRLVKSNPTPEYVGRIAAIFNDNGNGVRGDMKAVVQGILMDDEARNCESIRHFTAGKMKEPIHRYTQFLKAFNASTEADWFFNGGFIYDYFTNQYPLNSPTVFNFYLPDYTPNSAIADEGLVAPEFQIFNSATSVGYINFLYYMNLIDYYNEIPDFFTDLGIDQDYMATLDVPEFEILSQYPEALVDYLDLVLAHGGMTEETRDIISSTVEPLVVEPTILVKLALYLTMMAPDYVIMK